MKLKDLLIEKRFSLDNPVLEGPQRLSMGDKKKYLEKISMYGAIGKELHSENDMVEIAKALQEIAEYARKIALDDTEQDFDKITVTRNMQQIAKIAEDFAKESIEAKAIKQRMLALYEDLGSLLNRYFNIQDLIEPSNVETESVINEYMKCSGCNSTIPDLEYRKNSGKCSKCASQNNISIK